MTRFIDMDKLLHWLKGKIASNSEPYNDFRYERAIAYEDLMSEVNSGSFAPDSPQQPDIQMEKRNWQKCLEREKERADSAEADFQTLSDSYDELKKEKDFWESKRTEHKKRADRAESLIQQRNSEIERLKHIISSMARTEHELWEEPASAAECMMTWLNKAYDVQPEYSTRLQDEGDAV
ncbi:hypothetical protein [Paenibacillus polymyxa]|uniref:Uncharacterized protein n=1 Tax=Paenibacillus polymyxa (strain SC2) TaxID=886882 RepID=E3EL25_PAEPS|nr:hypothetical protein [Paenibacillus polymyxa]ADO59587.1 hypothetical protein PPSC2_27175 [Paenibacillus polymyxa SC2]WPQ59583.1 hypothetical protein SKN87_28375 [Paenibacillus polymyxa]